jgi:hypothetical protein
LDLEAVVDQWVSLYDELHQASLPEQNAAQEAAAISSFLTQPSEPLYSIYSLQSQLDKLRNPVRRPSQNRKKWFWNFWHPHSDSATE